MLTIYHNPRCRKSRETLALLEARGLAPKVHLYLQDPMPQDILSKALEIFGDKMVRKTEADYKTHGQGLSGGALIEVMLAHPKIIERPLVVNGDKMALGRPPERVLEILS